MSNLLRTGVMSDLDSDVVIIGAGLSGLSASKLLHEHGANVTILEATGRVGGRTYTKRDDFYKYADVGGSYVGPTQNCILRLAKEFGIKTYKINDDGDYVHYTKGHPVRFQGSWPKFRNPFAWLDVNDLFRKMENLLSEIPLKEPWLAPRAQNWDHVTMQQYYDKICWTKEAKEFGRAFVNTNVCMEPYEVSMLWFLWYVKSCGGTRRIWEVDNGGQERKFIGGSMLISEKIAEILGDRIIFNKPVTQIHQHDHSVTVVCANGDRYSAKYVILAMSPTLQARITYEPALPPLREQLLQRVPMGACIKNQVWYKEAFWRKHGMNGFGTVADGSEPVGNTVDDCRPDGSCPPSIVGFIMADQARRLSPLTREERKDLTLKSYMKLFHNMEALKCLKYEEHDWLSQPYSGGCYTSTYPPGVLTAYGPEIRKPIGRLYLAGTETALHWTGYMDGAVEAGERAARETLVAMGMMDPDSVWVTEPESADHPARPFPVSRLERYAPSVSGLLWGTAALCAAVLLKITYDNAGAVSKAVLKFLIRIYYDDVKSSFIPGALGKKQS